MTGPLAQQIAQVREVVPSREEIERRISQAEAVIEEPDEYPREYLTDARREITRCERLLIADAALSAIERHVQDMERERGELGPYFVRDVARLAGLPDDASMDWIYDTLRAALPASGTQTAANAGRNRVAREKGTE